MRTFLALLVRAESSAVRERRGMFTKLAVRKDRKDGDVAGSVVGDENELAGFVEGDVAGIFAKRGELVEQSELAGLRIEGESANGALLAGFIDGVSVFAVRVDGHKRWVGRFRRDSLRRELAGFCVVGKRVNALACGFVRVCADEHEIRVRRGRWLSASGKCDQNDGRSKNQYGENWARDFHGASV